MNFLSRNSVSDRPQNLQETYVEAEKLRKLYPNIFYIMSVLMCAPATSASVERAHSILKLIKNPRRSTMGQDRFISLALLYIHRDILLNYDRLIDAYAAKRPRRMLMTNPLADKEMT